ncbi:hypothetical protein R5W24_003055 [Gemmata sp. JC717]|uniref:hypothetical protein n=1 Tax=Gemmata algarum TaxID=2975278 RepID=UPI0021BABC96|nr:hypothetical protein [Gemmata algarum]MDY3553941.1 hypothetical protein [Gemmata algarum]
MGALNNAAVGAFVNEYFVSSYQKVATFKIVGGQKQGGNVAAYFCAPDGRVLHCVAGPVDAQTFLREAKWVVETTKTCMKDAKNDGATFKEMFRKAHAEKLRREFGIVVEAVTYDPPDPMDEKDALTYRDPTGRPLAPKLPPPPIDGPDVTLGAGKFEQMQKDAAGVPGNRVVACGKGGRVVVTNQGLVHQIMAAHAMIPIERVYGTVFETILGEKISTKPVDVVRPFTWVDKDGNRLRPGAP